LFITREQYPYFDVYFLIPRVCDHRQSSFSALLRRNEKFVFRRFFTTELLDRPEKDHPLQIRAMYELRQILPEAEWDQVRLLIIGGCRGQEDERLVQARLNIHS
jgi:hypothetical protein